MDSVRVTHSRPPDHAPWRLGALDCWADLQRRRRVLALGDVPGLPGKCVTGLPVDRIQRGAGCRGDHGSQQALHQWCWADPHAFGNLVVQELDGQFRTEQRAAQVEHDQHPVG